MNQKDMKKLLDSIDEQTMNQIANTYQATDSKTKEKIYQQVCERKKAMNQQEYKISETYHAKNINYMPWTRAFGIATACVLVMGGTVGGIWKLTRFNSPSENNNSQTETNVNTNIPSVIATETTIFSETSETVQTTTKITSQAMIQTAPETSISTTSTETSIITSITTQTAPITTTTTTTTTVTLPHKETVLAYETQSIITNSITVPVTNSVIETESPVTAPIIETTTTTTTQTEPITTRPAYVTAYLEICEEYEKDFNNLSYCLYDVDKDGTPELIIHGFSYWISLYTYADNQVYELMDKWSYGINNNMGYCFHPEKNSIYYNVGEYAGLIYHNIYLTITPEHKLVKETILTCVNDADTLFEQYPYLKNDDSHHYINGDGYYLNYEKITEEAYHTFYTENYPTNYNIDLNYQSYSEFSASLSE
ncbi:MAG: hypothetical protein K2H93_03965 [Oscillospiraceae bacterium]|nr:hypothetical protein [Oscillospiraceae bacterium]